MSVLRDAGEAAKGDTRGRRGGFKGKSAVSIGGHCTALTDEYRVLCTALTDDRKC